MRFLFVILTFFNLQVFSQVNHSSIHVISGLSNETTPFWQKNLTFGTIASKNPTSIIQYSYFHPKDSLKRRGLEYGLEANAWLGKENKLFFSELYAAYKTPKWMYWAGRKKEVYGLGDSILTSGFYAWSGNAIPLPKIQMNTNGFIPLFKDRFGVSMSYSHGWFDNTGNVEGAILHQKSLYGRIGKSNGKINFYGGLNHQVQYGGKLKRPIKNIQNEFPDNLTTYFYVVSGIKNYSLMELDPNTTSDDLENRYGNHLGSFDIAFSYQAKYGKWFVYRQTAYETGSAFTLIPADDGLSGISIKLYKKGIVNHLVFEHLFTANQGRYRSGIANLLNTFDSHYGELSSYMYNGARASGWRYFDKEIGTPLIVMDQNNVIGAGEKFTYNAVNVFYVGIEGFFNKNYSYQMRASKGYYSFLKSRQLMPFISQFSINLKVMKSIKNNRFIEGSIGIDEGELLKNTVGIQFSYKKIFK